MKRKGGGKGKKETKHVCFFKWKGVQLCLVLLWSECLCHPPSPKSYVVILPPMVMEIGGGPLGRLGHEDGILINGINALIEGAQEKSLAPSTI